MQKAEDKRPNDAGQRPTNVKATVAVCERRMENKRLAVPRSAYIHVPFCRHRCGYCNFTLVAGRDDLIEPYLAALDRELSWLGESREVDTLFFGGGTPTHLAPDHLKRLLEIVLRWHPLARNHEFSVEANPTDVNEELVDVLATNGVTRISLGAQSFDSSKLQLLERDHQATTIDHAVELVRSRGTDVSLDLIFGTPGESLSDWKNDLERAIELEPDHISTYGLTFEQGTSFWNRLQRGTLAKVEEEAERQMYELAIDRLAAAGFDHYEVSNFAKPEKRCRHNEVYWMGEEYFAAGPGAARYIGGIRESNQRSVFGWLKNVEAGKSPVAERERLLPEERARELLVFGLRRREGVEREWFAARTGCSIDELVGEPFSRFISEELLNDDGERVSLTRNGLLVSDAIWPYFLRSR